MSDFDFMCGLLTGAVVFRGVPMLLDYVAEKIRIKREKAELSPAPVADDSMWRNDLAFKRKPEGDGPLFGLSPPEGCRFKVIAGSEGYWHVRLEGPGFYAHEVKKGAPRKAIITAALKTLKQYEREKEYAELIGLYPPQDTRNIEQQTNPTDGDNNKEG